MRSIVRNSISLLALCLLCGVVIGCTGKKDETVTAPATTTTGGSGMQAGVQDRLSNPNIPESEKEQIRKHMGGGNAGAPTSPGGTTPAPGRTAAPGGAGGQ